MVEKLIIIGSGPAGWTAAIYTARSSLSPLIFIGSKAGGQLMLTTDVENYPGFDDGILGPDIMDKMRKQAVKFGAHVIDDDVVKVDFKKKPFKIFTNDKKYEASAVIISTGASPKWLHIPSEQRLIGKGVHNCATCDGYFYKNKDIIVVGGGDSAMEESLYLSKIAKSIRLLHRRDKLKASKIMQDRVKSNKKIKILWNTEVKEFIGDKKVEGVKIINNKTKKENMLKIDGAFVAIGYAPNTDIFKGQIDIDEKGYIMLTKDALTNINGVFAAGDCHDYKYRQAVTAAGDGCRAAMDAERYLGQYLHKK